MPTASPSSAIPCGSGACPRFRRCGGSDPPRHRSSRASPAPTETAIPCGSGACPRFRRCGGSDPPRHRSSRASPAPTETAIPLERGLPAIQTLRWIRPTASPLFAGKPGSKKNRNPVGARLARDSDAAVDQAHRVTALRGRARRQQKPQSPVGAVLARDSDAAMSQAHRGNVVLTQRVISYLQEAIPRWLLPTQYRESIAAHGSVPPLLGHAVCRQSAAGIPRR